MISIICPFHNEKDNLRELVERIAAVMKPDAAGAKVELLLVDDGSLDGGDRVVMALAQQYAWVVHLSHDQRRGQAAALSTGFAAARGEVVITMDADLQVLPEDLPLFLEKMGQGYDLVNGVRLCRREGFVFRSASAVLSFIMSVIVKTPIKDAASNYMAVRRKFILDLDLAANDHRYIIPIVCRRGAVRIAEVGIRHQDRRRGRSKYALSKVFFAFPEFLAFSGRLRRGYYR